MNLKSLLFSGIQTRKPNPLIPKVSRWLAPSLSIESTYNFYLILLFKKIISQTNIKYSDIFTYIDAKTRLILYFHYIYNTHPQNKNGQIRQAIKQGETESQSNHFQQLNCGLTIAMDNSQAAENIAAPGTKPLRRRISCRDLKQPQQVDSR